MHSHDVSFTLYGIKNCDTMKKARLWLDQRQLSYHFHDYRVDGVSLETLQRFLINTTWQALLNTRGSTWRKFSAGHQCQRRLATDGPPAVGNQTSGVGTSRRRFAGRFRPVRV
jgi:hypothetical protein